MSYKLGIQNKGITEIQDLSEEDYQRYKNTSGRLISFSRDQQLYAAVLLNYDDFADILNKLTKEYEENPSSFNWIWIERILLDVNRYSLIINQQFA